MAVSKPGQSCYYKISFNSRGAVRHSSTGPAVQFTASAITHTNMSLEACRQKSA